MKWTAINSLVLIGCLAATTAMAVDLPTRKSAHLPAQKFLAKEQTMALTAVLGCDDGNAYSGYYQNTDDRIGNIFDFGSGAILSQVGFLHYGYGTPGPYNYNVEVWDPTSCTPVAIRKNFVATDAANQLEFDIADLCENALFVTGVNAVVIDPNTCNSPTDCYPDIVFDDQLGVTCPIIIANASTAPICYDMSPYSGPFILRVQTDNCPTPALKKTWGGVKSHYN